MSTQLRPCAFLRCCEVLPLRLDNAHTVTKTSFYLREPVEIYRNQNKLAQTSSELPLDKTNWPGHLNPGKNFGMRFGVR